MFHVNRQIKYVTVTTQPPGDESDELLREEGD